MLDPYTLHRPADLLPISPPLGYVSVKSGNAELVVNSTGIVSLESNGISWMAIDRQSVLEILSQFDDAVGDVLVVGLGMGILPLLIQTKPEVKMIDVVEIDRNVIDIFQQQPFDRSKINIIQSAVEDFSGGKYDCVLVDHYNYMSGLDRYVIDQHDMLAAKCDAGSFNYYLWTSMVNRSYDHYISKVAPILGMNKYPKQQFDEYIAVTHPLYRDTPDRIVDAINTINLGCME